jgi:hypothetical protein
LDSIGYDDSLVSIGFESSTDYFNNALPDTPGPFLYAISSTSATVLEIFPAGGQAEHSQERVESGQRFSF